MLSDTPHGVLVTRPEAEAPATAARLAARGFTPVIAPMLRVKPLSGTLSPRAQAILLTSGNALAALPPPRHWANADIPVLAVGDVTAARARGHGFANVHSAGRDAAALVELAAGLLNPEGGPLLLACGRHQGLALARQLRARHFRVSRRAVYAAVPVDAFPRPAEEALARQMLCAAMFLSAETAAAFVRLLPPTLSSSLRCVVALAIGKPAADALKPLPWREVRLAAAPTLDDVLALL